MSRAESRAYTVAKARLQSRCKGQIALMGVFPEMRQIVHYLSLLLTCTGGGEVQKRSVWPEQEERASLPYPTVRDYLEWVRKRITVSFRRLDQPKARPTRLGVPCSAGAAAAVGLEAAVNCSKLLLCSLLLQKRGVLATASAWQQKLGKGGVLGFQ